MLRFQTPPDKPFMAIITESIETMIEQIEEFACEVDSAKEVEDNFKWLLPNASRVFNIQTAINTLIRILECHQRPSMYHLNDYHYLLLYDTLDHFCAIHNDMMKDLTPEDRIEHTKIGEYYIEMIRFNDIVDMYFFDTDFLSDPKTMLELGMDARKDMSLSNESFAISQGLSPHPEELKIKMHKKEEAVIQEPSDLFGPKSKIYPDYR
jgi:hypothetical protein